MTAINDTVAYEKILNLPADIKKNIFDRLNASKAAIGRKGDPFDMFIVTGDDQLSATIVKEKWSSVKGNSGRRGFPAAYHALNGKSRVSLTPLKSHSLKQFRKPVIAQKNFAAADQVPSQFEGELMTMAYAAIDKALL